MKHGLILHLVFLIFTTVRCARFQFCHPECTNTCNTSIICPAVCLAITKPAQCQVFCNPSSYVPYFGQCEFSCYEFYNTSLNQCELGGCPAVETKCSPLKCVNIPFNVACQLECFEPQSSWFCSSPIPIVSGTSKCNYTISLPDCASSWSCDPPACQYVSDSVTTQTNMGLLLLLLLLFTFL